MVWSRAAATLAAGAQDPAGEDYSGVTADQAESSFNAIWASAIVQKNAEAAMQHQFDALTGLAYTNPGALF